MAGTVVKLLIPREGVLLGKLRTEEDYESHFILELHITYSRALGILKRENMPVVLDMFTYALHTHAQIIAHL